MIDWLVNRIFSIKPLREALFAEVHMYDEIGHRLKDTAPGSMFWHDGDGWRSWTYSAGENKYYFNDIPENELGDAMEYMLNLKGPEFKMDEVW